VYVCVNVIFLFFCNCQNVHRAPLQKGKIETKIKKKKKTWPQFIWVCMCVYVNTVCNCSTYIQISHSHTNTHTTTSSYSPIQVQFATILRQLCKWQSSGERPTKLKGKNTEREREREREREWESERVRGSKGKRASIVFCSQRVRAQSCVYLMFHWDHPGAQFHTLT